MQERFDFVVQGGAVFHENRLVEADLGVRNGRIAAIGHGLEGAETIDARGLWVLPGLVDPHVHPIHAEDYQTVSEAALHGGVTTLFHMLYTPADESPQEFSAAAAREAEAQSLADFSFHVRLNELRRTKAEIGPISAGGTPSFKLFLAYGSRGVMVADDEVVLAMQAARRAGATLLFHAENGPVTDLLEEQARAEGKRQLIEYYRSRPKWLETEAVRRTIYAAEHTGASCYFVHLTCPESVQTVTEAKLRGTNVYAETCPHYLLLTAEEAASFGAKGKMAPPLRDAPDRDRLWKSIARGLIDSVGSDHSAFDPEEKENMESVFHAGFGVPGIATMFPLLYDRGVRGGRCSLADLVRVMSRNPAEIFGLGGRKGSLGIGRDADFFLFDPKRPFEITDDSEHGAGYYSLYAGMAGTGSIRSVYAGGKLRVSEDALVDGESRGRYLRREPGAGDAAEPDGTGPDRIGPDDTGPDAAGTGAWGSPTESE
jgi:dihydropyrimidinase